MSVPDRRTGGRYLWERDLKMEARAKSNLGRRVGTFVWLLLTWLVVGTGLTTFVELVIITAITFTALTAWDTWKMWKGKQNVIG